MGVGNHLTLDILFKWLFSVIHEALIGIQKALHESTRSLKKKKKISSNELISIEIGLGSLVGQTVFCTSTFQYFPQFFSVYFMHHYLPFSVYLNHAIWLFVL